MCQCNNYWKYKPQDCSVFLRTVDDGVEIKSTSLQPNEWRYFVITVAAEMDYLIFQANMTVNNTDVAGIRLYVIGPNDPFTVPSSPVRFTSLGERDEDGEYYDEDDEYTCDSRDAFRRDCREDYERKRSISHRGARFTANEHDDAENQLPNDVRYWRRTPIGSEVNEITVGDADIGSGKWYVGVHGERSGEMTAPTDFMLVVRSLSLCPSNCAGHGECENTGRGRRCRCAPNFIGDDCTNQFLLLNGGTPLRGRVSYNSWSFYKVTVLGQNALRLHVNESDVVNTPVRPGLVAVYARREADNCKAVVPNRCLPTLKLYNYFNDSATLSHEIFIPSQEANGTWYVGVTGSLSESGRPEVMYSIEATVGCDLYTGCDMCVTDPNCGWCAQTALEGNCIAGSAHSKPPFTCAAFVYDTCSFASHQRKSTTAGMIIGIVVGFCVVVIIVSSMVYFWYSESKKAGAVVPAAHFVTHALLADDDDDDGGTGGTNVDAGGGGGGGGGGGEGERGGGGAQSNERTPLNRSAALTHSQYAHRDSAAADASGSSEPSSQTFFDGTGALDAPHFMSSPVSSPQPSSNSARVRGLFRRKADEDEWVRGGEGEPARPFGQL